jgi:hypothetical protein
MKDEGERLSGERNNGRNPVIDSEDRYEFFCPFLQNETDTCLAAIFPMATGYKAKFNYCGNENYDTCPLFLAKILRDR